MDLDCGALDKPLSVVVLTDGVAHACHLRRTSPYRGITLRDKHLCRSFALVDGLDAGQTPDVVDILCFNQYL